MLFHSYFFIFVFLPPSLSAWYLFNRMTRFKLAQGYPIGISLWFYAWYDVRFRLAISGTVSLCVSLSLLLSRS